MVYLFIGEDELSKKIKLQAVKKENLTSGLDSFNSQTIFAKGLELVELQEILLKYPIREKKFILVIKEIENLSQDIKDFILKYLKNPSSRVILILDIYQFDTKDNFVNKLTNNNQIRVFNFKRSFYPSVFSLGRLISQKKAQEALLVLNELMLQKAQAQKIIGGLRYQLEKEPCGLEEKTKRFEILLDADRSIKTGEFATELALEILLVKLCSR